MGRRPLEIRERLRGENVGVDVEERLGRVRVVLEARVERRVEQRLELRAVGWEEAGGRGGGAHSDTVGDANVGDFRNEGDEESESQFWPQLFHSPANENEGVRIEDATIRI